MHLFHHVVIVTDFASYDKNLESVNTSHIPHDGNGRKTSPAKKRLLWQMSTKLEPVQGSQRFSSCSKAEQ